MGNPSVTAAISVMPSTAAKTTAVTVSIIREKKEQNLTLTVPDRNQSQILDLDESVETPDTDAETAIDLSQAQSEVARMKPEIERAIRG